MTTTFETAKVGDRVWALVWGWGVVESINERKKEYPITVKRPDGSISTFTLKGYYDIRHIHQRIYWDEIKFDVPKKPVEVPAKDVLVLVKTCCNSTPLPRYSTGVLNPTGNLLCYEAGCTSKTHGSNLSNGGRITHWPLWEVAD